MTDEKTSLYEKTILALSVALNVVRRRMVGHVVPATTRSINCPYTFSFQVSSYAVSGPLGHYLCSVLFKESRLI
jgi:hypothetical protein